MDLSQYMPMQFTTADEAEYCSFMYQAYLSFSEQENYHFAYLAAHILMMYMIYLKLWQLSKTDSRRVIDALTLAHYDRKDAIGHGTSLKEIVENAKSPMTYKIFKIEERVFVKVLTLLDCEDYAPFKKAIDFRNNLAHPNGLLYFTDAGSFEGKLNEIEELIIRIHDSSTRHLGDYLTTLIGTRKYSRPYVETEIQNDVDQLVISPFMLSARDCISVSSLIEPDTKLNTLIRDYLIDRAAIGGYVVEEA